MTEVTPEILAHQLLQLTDAVSSLAADVTVMMVIVRRIDQRVVGLEQRLGEIEAGMSHRKGEEQ